MGRLNETRIIGAAIGPGFGARATTATEATLHAQHGVALFVALEGEVTVKEASGATIRGRVVVVPPDLAHANESPAPTLGLLYDPEELPRVARFSRSRGGAFALEGPSSTRLAASVSAHASSLSSAEVLSGVAVDAARELGSRAEGDLRRDPRVERVLEALRDPSSDRGSLAAEAHLSRAHLAALFLRDVGLPIRSYVLWQRLVVAVTSLRRLDATSAAHAAGFADLAHFSRTCRRMLGHSPSALF
jgi:AraC-like DNA-binding protein